MVFVPSSTVAALVVVGVLAGCGPDPARSRRHAPSASPLPEPTSTPTRETLLRFAVVGDFGTGDGAQRAVARRMCRWRQRRAFDLVVTTGDNVYPDGVPSRFEAAFFEPYACLLDAGVRVRASLGNHDVVTDGGRPEIDEAAFGMRGRNYVVRRGGVRFVVASSTYLDREWLRRATRADPGDAVTIAVFHHPVFSPGTGHGSTPGFRPQLPRLFARRGVDLVLNGHDHVYAATRPLRGIRYVVTGGGGAPLYGCSDAWFSRRCVARHHFLYVVARTDGIDVRAVGTTGPPFHRFFTAGRAPGG